MAINIFNKFVEIIHEIEELCFSTLKCTGTYIHGVQHLREVAYSSGRLAHALNLDCKTAILAGYLHDCARNNDSVGNSHAHESAFLAKKIIEKNWSTIDVDKIFHTIYYHADGLTSSDSFIGCIWDADRLNLIRLGIIPKVELLSTEIAKRVHSRFIEKNNLFHQITYLASNIQTQAKRTGKAFIGIWYTEYSNIVLQTVFNILDESFNFNFSQLSIISLFEYSNTPKKHDQSCCFQIYRSCSNRIILDQIVCPMHDLNYQDIFSKNIPCIISYAPPYYPLLDGCLLTLNKMNYYPINVETRNYLSRYYEKSNNTPDSIITLPVNFFNKIEISIVLINKSSLPVYSDISSKIPESLHLNNFVLNHSMMYY